MKFSLSDFLELADEEEEQANGFFLFIFLFDLLNG